MWQGVRGNTNIVRLFSETVIKNSPVEPTTENIESITYSFILILVNC